MILGYANASAFRSRAAYRSTVEDTVYVAPAFAGRGVGTLLLRALLEQCGRRGFCQVIAVIGGRNPASVRLHERAGFARVGVLARVGYKFGAWQHVTLMQREQAREGGALQVKVRSCLEPPRAAMVRW